MVVVSVAEHLVTGKDLSVISYNFLGWFIIIILFYYATMAARQNNAVQYTHIHANLSTKKTQKDKNSKKEQN